MVSRILLTSQNWLDALALFYDAVEQLQIVESRLGPASLDKDLGSLNPQSFHHFRVACEIIHDLSQQICRVVNSSNGKPQLQIDTIKGTPICIHVRPLDTVIVLDGFIASQDRGGFFLLASLDHWADQVSSLLHLRPERTTRGQDPGDKRP